MLKDDLNIDLPPEWVLGRHHFNTAGPDIGNPQP